LDYLAPRQLHFSIGASKPLLDHDVVRERLLAGLLCWKNWSLRLPRQQYWSRNGKPQQANLKAPPRCVSAVFNRGHHFWP
jgi:hypothetical protein